MKDLYWLPRDRVDAAFNFVGKSFIVLLLVGMVGGSVVFTILLFIDGLWGWGFAMILTAIFGFLNEYRKGR